MSAFSWLWGSGAGGSTPFAELPISFPLPCEKMFFIETDVVSIYSKILIDTLERTSGISDDQQALMWDNCVKTGSQDGLVTMLACAMFKMTDLFLVYEKAVGVIRIATPEERTKIEEDYKKQAKSSSGVFISFRNYKRSKMLELYLSLEYANIGSLYKSMNLSKAVQFKASDLRASVSLVDKDDVKSQAQAMAEGLACGRDVLMDAKDVIETAVPDLTAVNQSVELVCQKLAFYLGMPSAYLTGEQTGGLGTTGEGDAKAVDRGLKGYFYSIVKPVLNDLLGVTVSYKSEDIKQIIGSLELLKTFSLTDDELVSHENKLKIVNMIFGLPEDAQGDAPKPQPKQLPPPVVPVPKAPPVSQ